MALHRLIAAAAVSLLILLAGGCEQGNQGADPRTPVEIGWPDLLPASERETLDAMRAGRAGQSELDEYSASAREHQAGSFRVVEDLDGVYVRMPGFLLPLDVARRGEARQFLLLPYHGACVHYPAPPPNQIVYVTSDDPIEFDRLWDPVWIEGVLQVERMSTELAESAYAMSVSEVEPYSP